MPLDPEYRTLIASILKTAYEDFNDRRKLSNKLEAATFLSSDWCKSLCDGIDIEHSCYVQAVLRGVGE